MLQDEADLLRRLKLGDTDAYMQLYQHYHPALYVYVIRFIKVPQLAEDALQEVFIKIWEIRERINPELSFSAYLYRISRNHVFKQLKKIAADEDLRMRAMLALANTVEDTDTRVRWQQYEALLKMSIDQLPTQRKKVFELCRQQGKTYDEVAAELGISRNTVKEHMVMAVKSIKEYFTRHGDITLVMLLSLEIL